MIVPEDRKILKSITTKIKRIIKKDISNIKDEEVKFLLYQAFITVDTFLSSASAEVELKEEKVSNA